MGKIKEPVRIPSIELKYESDDTKKWFEALCYGKDIRWELYHVLDLNSTEKTKFERISHYTMAEWLHEEINNIDAFFSWKRTFNSCNRWDFSHLRGSILISMFTSYKENYMSEKWYSWENWLSQIINEDLASLNVSRRVDIIKPSADKVKSDQWIISEIRNALDHTHYIAQWNTVHVRNPQTGFEAKVPFDFLYDFITLVQNKSRRDFAYGIDTNDKSIYQYPNNFKFDDIKNKVQYRMSINSNKDNPAHDRNFDEYKKLMQINKNWAEETERTEKEIKFTNQLENVAKTYFNENGNSKKRKWHKIDYKNLKYLWMNLAFPPENFMREILDCMKHKIESKDCKFNSTDFIDEFGKHICDFLWDPAFRRWESDTEISELFYFEKALLEQKLENWQSILKQLSKCWDFAVKYFKDHGFEYVKKIVDGREVWFLKKWIIEIKTSNIDDVCGALNSYYFIGCQIAESFPDWLKIQFVESVYVNELISLKNDDVPWLVGGWMRKQNDKFTNREHVRNAFVHNNYTMLHWVDEIVLRDGYDKRTDTREREETISLPKLYEETHKEMVHNMENETDMVIEIAGKNK